MKHAATRAIYDRFAPLIALMIMFMITVIAVATFANDRAISQANADAIEANTANAVTSCQNANQTREASRSLWNFVVDLSLARNQDVTSEEKAYLTEFRDWIGKVYEERDCDDLSRKYPLPPPPTIPAG